MTADDKYEHAIDVLSRRCVFSAYVGGCLSSSYLDDYHFLDDSELGSIDDRLLMIVGAMNPMNEEVAAAAEFLAGRELKDGEL